MRTAIKKKYKIIDAGYLHLRKTDAFVEMFFQYLAAANFKRGTRKCGVDLFRGALNWLPLERVS